VPDAESPAPASGSVVARQRPLTEVDGSQLALGLRASLAWLQANQEVINALNVFPVPDGDTGSNMFLTLRSAVDEVEKLEDRGSAAAVVQAAAHGSLMGARGNSGVILSQVLRGFAQGLAGRERVDAPGIAAGLKEASTVAYKAVMKPKEGTILTVVRETADAAERAAAETSDIRTVLDAAVSEAHAAVERTPEQLAVLRDAGVVDAGGFGLAVVLEGFVRALQEARMVEAPPPPPPRRVGEPLVRAPSGETDWEFVEGRRGAAAVAAREESWGYCTEFLIQSPPALDVDTLRTELSALGESSMVVGDADMVRVHIHTQDPAALIALAAQRGRLSRLKVENMSVQHHEVLERAEREEAAPRTRKALGIVTVAPGKGFREILGGLGADQVVEGGQTMNPSIEDLLNAVHATGAESVVILPNNKNVILTAHQVDGLAKDVDVRVVPSRNLPQGISALLALDPLASIDVNCARMEESLSAVTTVEVTTAVRDSVANGKKIHAGDVIAVVDDKITQVGGDPLEVVEAVLAERGSEPELITVYRGSGVDDREAGGFVKALQERHPSCELEVHVGGQEHYPYILSLE